MRSPLGMRKASSSTVDTVHRVNCCDRRCKLTSALLGATREPDLKCDVGALRAPQTVALYEHKRQTLSMEEASNRRRKHSVPL
jgi:hypothetical protein